MRELTQQEIDDKPEWATHYYLTSYESILMWDSEFIDSVNNSRIPAKVKPCELFGTDGSQPIPRKEFDIGSHDWSDESIVVIASDDDCIELMCDISGDVFDLSREDFIAGSKHFKLTGSDLK